MVSLVRLTAVFLPFATSLSEVLIDSLGLLIAGLDAVRPLALGGVRGHICFTISRELALGHNLLIQCLFGNGELESLRAHQGQQLLNNINVCCQAHAMA